MSLFFLTDNIHLSLGDLARPVALGENKREKEVSACITVRVDIVDIAEAD